MSVASGFSRKAAAVEQIHALCAVFRLKPEATRGVSGSHNRSPEATTGSFGLGSRRAARTRKIASGVDAIFRDYGAGNGIRTRDFDLGKVALYH